MYFVMDCFCVKYIINTLKKNKWKAYYIEPLDQSTFTFNFTWKYLKPWMLTVRSWEKNIACCGYHMTVPYVVPATNHNRSFWWSNHLVSHYLWVRWCRSRLKIKVMINCKIPHEQLKFLVKCTFLSFFLCMGKQSHAIYFIPRQKKNQSKAKESFNKNRNLIIKK